MKVAIIAAMKEELELFKERCSIIKEEQEASFTFYIGIYEGKDIVLMQCGIGKVNAGIGTSLLIHRYKPDYIINSGVAGGMGNDVSLLDLVISEELCYHDVDVTAFDYPMGQVPGLPIKFQADKTLFDAAMATTPAEGSSIHYGVIASGDSFIHEYPQIMQITRHFPEALAVEMEGAAVAQTAHLFHVPFVVIRSISDIIQSDGSHQTYENTMEKAALISSDFVLQMIQSL